MQKPSQAPHQSATSVCALQKPSLALCLCICALVILGNLRAGDQAAEELFYIYYQPLIPVIIMIWLWGIVVRYFERNTVKYDVCFPTRDQKFLLSSRQVFQVGADSLRQRCLNCASETVCAVSTCLVPFAVQSCCQCAMCGPIEHRWQVCCPVLAGSWAHHSGGGDKCRRLHHARCPLPRLWCSSTPPCGLCCDAPLPAAARQGCLPGERLSCSSDCLPACEAQVPLCLPLQACTLSAQWH